MATWQEAWNKAKELGATEVYTVINWNWAKNFPTPEAGKEFVKWCDENEVENRGYHPADPNATNPNFLVDGVRFR